MRGVLPSVTSLDDGKFLGVVDGAWSKADVSNNNDYVVPFTVSTDGGVISISTEKRIRDIVAAARAGKNVYAVADIGIYVQKMPLTAYGDGFSGAGLVGFGWVIPDSGSSKSTMGSAIGNVTIVDGVETDRWLIYTE